MTTNKKKLHVFFSGGGTLGPITPLLAIEDALKKKHADLDSTWIVTKKGVEHAVLSHRDTQIRSIATGKLRRYLSFTNIADVFRVFIGFFQSLYLLWRYTPDICISAGGYASVPLHLAAWFLHVPTWIHAQDVVPGLANRLMAPLATRVTVALEQGKASFSNPNISWLGNPVRSDIFDVKNSEARQKLGLDPSVPVVLIFGGGTGSDSINELVDGALPSIDGKFQVVHIVGSERHWERHEKAQEFYSFYHPYTFLSEEMKYAYAAADVVVCRAGFGTLSECAALKKAVVTIPKKGHQEANARYLSEKGAVVMLEERLLDSQLLVKEILLLLNNNDTRTSLEKFLHQAIPQMREPDMIEIFQDVLT